MPLPIRLEVFRETPDPSPDAMPTRPEEIEEVRLVAYERGYNAGWEDADRQAERVAGERRAAVERQLEALSFTHHEARGHVLRAIEPLLAAMLETVLPEGVRASLVPMVLEQLLPLAGSVADAPLVLQVSPGARADFEAVFAGFPLPAIEIVETPMVGEGRAELVFGDRQTVIDLAGVAQDMRAAIGRFYQIEFEERRHA